MALLAGAASAQAQNAGAPPSAVGTGAAPPAAATPSLQPTVGGPLSANPEPAAIDLGPLGPINVTGVLSGVGLAQNHAFLGDRGQRLDFSNALIFVQKADGPIQFFIAGGVYKIPSLGAIDRNAIDNVRLLYSPVPQAFLKYAPTDSFSILAGRLPTLIGPESPFTFQNVNIQRGLLFNQTPTFSQGVQANYSTGPLSFSLSLNDGFFSNRLNWISGAVTYKFDDSNSLLFDAGTNLGRTNYSTVATPLLQNNSSIYNLVYTYSSGAFSISPYLQFTNVQRDLTLGISESASTYSGAVLASYKFTPEWSLAGRVEYIAQSGDRNTGVTSLLYGPGSQAVSFTVTPTYQRGVFFTRAEYAYVKAIDATPGLAFGRTGTNTTQNRFLVEAGIIF